MASALDLLNRFDQVQALSQQYGVRPELIHAVMSRESGGDPSAVSPKGAVGLMQVMPATAASPGFGMKPFDPNDPNENLRGGVEYLSNLVKRYGGDEAKALAAYNAGPGRVDKGAPLPKETQAYVPAVQAAAGKPTEGAAQKPTDATKSALDLLNEYDASQAPPAGDRQIDYDKIEANRGFIDNLRESAGNFVHGIADTIESPWATAKTLGKTAIGAVESLAPTGRVNPAIDYRKYAQNLGTFYKNRYGSLDKIKNTLYTDPVGAVADAASAFTGAGEVLEGANVAAKSSTLGRIAELAKATGSAVDPLRLPTNVAALAQPAERAIAERVVASNLKVPKTLKKQNLTVNIPQTILEEGLAKGNIKKAAATASQRVEDMSGQISDLVRNDTGRYSLQPLLDQLDALEREYLHQPNAETDLAAVRNARRQLLDHPFYGTDVTKNVPVTTTQQVPTGAQNALGQPITQSQPVTTMQPTVVGRTTLPQTAEEIDRMKKNVYTGLKGKYGKEQSAVIEADKAQGRGLKSILDQNVPGVQAINERQRKVIVARNALTDAAMRNENKYPIGLMDLAGGAAEAGIALSMSHHPLMAAIAGLPVAAGMLLKHPSTAMPIASGLWKAGTASMPFEGVVRNITPAERVNEAQGSTGIDLNKAKELYTRHVAAEGAQ